MRPGAVKKGEGFHIYNTPFKTLVASHLPDMIRSKRKVLTDIPDIWQMNDHKYRQLCTDTDSRYKLCGGIIAA